MKERPILFSTLMVQALLAGNKTQTRRVIFPHTDYTFWAQPSFLGLETDPDSCFKIKRGDIVSDKYGNEKLFTFKGLHALFEGDQFTYDNAYIKSSYGQPRDVLWVRETWMPLTIGYVYRADNIINENFKGVKWHPSIFMPKEACRIKLQINDIRVQELQNISEGDAVAEGIERDRDGWKSYEIIHTGKHKGQKHPHSYVPNRSPITSYKELWESINGLDSWSSNPWVWCITFKKL